MSEERPRVDTGELTRFSTEALVKLGVPEEEAEITARILVACDLRGVESHGVAHLRMFYANRIRRGLINVTPKTQLFSRAPSTAVMDGDNGLGFVVGYYAMNEAISRAKETGAGFVAARNSTHYGAAAYYAMMALEHDMIGFSGTNNVPIVVAPGSSVPAISSNPIAVAVPAGEKPAIVLDMATSTCAGGKIEIAMRTGSDIPEGWVIDVEGQPVTDPTKRFRGGGGMLPLGGSPEMGVYKGFGLGLVVDLLSGPLSGSVASLIKETTPEARGNYSDHFFGALRIDSFTLIEDFKKSVDAFINALEALPRIPGVDRITLPGPYEAEIAEERQANGIPLDPKVVDDLKLLAEELGMEYNL